MNRLLLRSYDQDQFDNYDLTTETLKDVEYVYVPPLAIDMWSRLQTSSVFMEMYMDDIWLDEDFRNVRKSSYSGGFSTENFEVCLEYMNTLIQAERNIYLRGKQRGLAYDEVRFDYFFGSESICRHLISGLENSLNAYYRNTLDRNTLDVYYLAENERVEGWRNRIGTLKAESKISTWG